VTILKIHDQKIGVLHPGTLRLIFLTQLSNITMIWGGGGQKNNFSKASTQKLFPDLLYQHIKSDCGAIGGMEIGRGNRSTRRKPGPSATFSTANPT
jgi:hypothetical protein